ncbi:MAG: NAD-dependent epimerase/dehydratase family protein, partial [Planctomycetota bacterium]
MKVLIIGGSGHVSGAVARKAVADNHEVWAVTRGNNKLPDGVNSLIADRKNDNQLTEVVSNADTNWDLIVDCICYEPEFMQQDIRLLKDKAKHFVFVSTDFVYDPFTRTFPQSVDNMNFVSDGEKSNSYGYKKRKCEE